ncbi:hypothetical protein C7M84_009943 [Penaeus vannamei]|uniref:Uncharacterized protein n=1 Tax=Penaeus vannamei TaxID=6689 RepID=A0A423T5Q2_PENVA|nr:hypothetical protein C7M84_009943 [Penaeus vannamei]
MKILVCLFAICTLLPAVTSNKLLKDTGQGQGNPSSVEGNDQDVYVVKVVPAHMTAQGTTSEKVHLKVQGSANEREHVKVQGTASERVHLKVQGTSERVDGEIKKTGKKEGEEKVFLEKNLEFCKVIHQMLACDFKGKKLVRVKDFPAGEGVEKLIIRNVVEVLISGPVCLDLVLEDIGNVTVEGRLPSDCPAGRELVLKNVTLNRLPEAVNSVYVSTSVIEEMALHVADTFLVKESRIGSLNVSTSPKSGVDVTLYQTEVDLLEKLRVGNGSALHVFNCTFGNIRKHAVILGPGKHVVRDIIMKHPSSTTLNIGLRGEAEATFTNVSGSMKVVHEPCPLAVRQTPCSPRPRGRRPKPSFRQPWERRAKRQRLGASVCGHPEREGLRKLPDLLFNQPRDLLMKMCHIESPSSDRPGSSRRKRDSTMSEDGDAAFLTDANVVGGKRGTSFPGNDRALGDDNGDAFGNPVFVSEIQMIDERRPRTYRHSVSVDSKEEAEILLNGSESKKCLSVPRRRIRSSNSS